MSARQASALGYMRDYTETGYVLNDKIAKDKKKKLQIKVLLSMKALPYAANLNPNR